MRKARLLLLGDLQHRAHAAIASGKASCALLAHVLLLLGGDPSVFNLLCCVMYWGHLQITAFWLCEEEGM